MAQRAPPQFRKWWQELEAGCARAAAQAPGQRSADAAAVMQCVQLLRQATQLLPLDGRGQPELGDSPAEQRQVQAALALAAQADALYPDLGIISPLSPAQRHLAVYLGWGVRQAQRAAAAAAAAEEEAAPSPISELDHLLLAGTYSVVRCQAENVLDDAGFILQALEDTDVMQLAAAQLAQLAADSSEQLRALLPTFGQLQFACSLRAAAAAATKLMQSAREVRQPRSPRHAQAHEARQAEARAVLAAAGRGMLQLQPHNPKSFVAAVEHWQPAAEDNGPTGAQKALALFLHLADLGRRSGSDYWLAYAASQLLQLASGAMGPLSAEAQQQLCRSLPGLAAAAEAALRCCRGLLPAVSVRTLEGPFTTSRRLLADAKRAAAQGANLPASSLQGSSLAALAPIRSSSAASGPSSSTGSASTAAPAARANGQQLVPQPPPPPPPPDSAPCAACGAADGAGRLAMCHRCRKVRYCSRQCQAGHWLKHKQSCEPWVFALQRQAPNSAGQDGGGGGSG